ncbi:hypothetical protein [Tahibacter caeni]|uniref:hypothetical protein n=1 Tax=Tahibacter caeni TaxID=1453545 RepID=UPI0021499448|nr:hypothetical protein [Tahibacter caeni]
MRNALRSAAALLLTVSAGAVMAGGYVLTVDGKATELDLDKDAEVLVGGKAVTVRLQRKEQQQFRDAGLSFDHPAGVQPSTTDINANVRQIMLVSANGNGAIVQRYAGLDPNALVDLMVNETTDEEVAAGYQRKIAPATRTLADGRALSGKQVRTESKDESWSRTIVATGNARGGYLVITMMEDERAAADAAMIERFWKTLKLD